MEFNAEQAKEFVRQYPSDDFNAELYPVGVIIDQEEAFVFLEWLCGPEGQAIAEQVRIARGEG